MVEGKVSTTKTEYIQEIIENLNQCENIALLDLILHLAKKGKARQGKDFGDGK